MKDQLKKWIEKNWGKRCPDYEKSCALCRAWTCYDYLMSETDEEKIKAYIKDKKSIGVKKLSLIKMSEDLGLPIEKIDKNMTRLNIKEAKEQ